MTKAEAKKLAQEYLETYGEAMIDEALEKAFCRQCGAVHQMYEGDGLYITFSIMVKEPESKGQK